MSHENQALMSHHPTRLVTSTLAIFHIIFLYTKFYSVFDFRSYIFNAKYVDSPVVYWLGHVTLMWAMVGSNLIRNPLLTAKAVDHQPSLHVFGTSLWIGKTPWSEPPKLSNDRFERTNAGSHEPMVLIYSFCVVLCSGPALLGTAWNIPYEN